MQAEYTVRQDVRAISAPETSDTETQIQEGVGARILSVIEPRMMENAIIGAVRGGAMQKAIFRTPDSWFENDVA